MSDKSKKVRTLSFDTKFARSIITRFAVTNVTAGLIPTVGILITIPQFALVDVDTV